MKMCLIENKDFITVDNSFPYKKNPALHRKEYLKAH